MPTVTRIQKYSSYAFTIFGAFHIANTSIIPLITRNVQSADTYLLLTRPYYQSLPFEPILITGALGLHISSGIALRLFRRRQQRCGLGAIIEVGSELRREELLQRLEVFVHQ